MFALLAERGKAVAWALVDGPMVAVANIFAGALGVVRGSPRELLCFLAGISWWLCAPLQWPIQIVLAAIYGRGVAVWVTFHGRQVFRIRLYGCTGRSGDACGYARGAFSLPGCIWLGYPGEYTATDGRTLQSHEAAHQQTALMLGPIYYPVAILDIVVHGVISDGGWLHPVTDGWDVETLKS